MIVCVEDPGGVGMCVMQTSERAVAIWFAEEPPSRRRLMALVRGALKTAGFAPWPVTEADCFRLGNETLLIARPGRRDQS